MVHDMEKKLCTITYDRKLANEYNYTRDISATQLGIHKTNDLVNKHTTSLQEIKDHTIANDKQQGVRRDYPL